MGNRRAKRERPGSVGTASKCQCASVRFYANRRSADSRRSPGNRSGAPLERPTSDNLHLPKMRPDTNRDFGRSLAFHWDQLDQPNTEKQWGRKSCVKRGLNQVLFEDLTSVAATIRARRAIGLVGVVMKPAPFKDSRGFQGTALRCRKPQGEQQDSDQMPRPDHQVSKF